MGLGGVSTTLRQLYPREIPGTHCTGSWVGPRAGLDGCRKSRPPPGFDPRTVQPVASRYTDSGIPAAYILGTTLEIILSEERTDLSPHEFWAGFEAHSSLYKRFTVKAVFTSLHFTPHPHPTVLEL